MMCVLGFEPTQVLLAGDSAGGNLALCVALKAVMEGVRVPDGLFLLYPALFCYPTPTPSRLLFGNDPVIPRVMLAACLEAYLPHLQHNRAGLSGVSCSFVV
jgi:acetyl esterase/lipase